MNTTMQFTHDMVRLMGVHVLAVYVLLHCAEQEGLVPVQAKWILEHMPPQTSPNTVTKALSWLTSYERQIAVKVTGGWRLTEKAYQLPLGYLPLESDTRPEPQVLGNHSQRDFHPQRNFPSNGRQVITARARKPFHRVTDISHLTEDQKAIWRICKKIGIGEPTRTIIAEETDYPPEYIWAHGIYGAREGLEIRLIIHRISDKNWLPETVKMEARETIDQFFIEENDSGEGSNGSN